MHQYLSLGINVFQFLVTGDAYTPLVVASTSMVILNQCARSCCMALSH